MRWLHPQTCLRNKVYSRRRSARRSWAHSRWRTLRSTRRDKKVKGQRFSYFHTAQGIEHLFSFRHQRGQFLAGLDRSVPRKIASLEQLLKRLQDLLGYATRTKVFFDDGL